MPANVTAVAPVRLVPEIFTLVPTGPFDGLKPLIVGTLDAAEAPDSPTTPEANAIATTTINAAVPPPPRFEPKPRPATVPLINPTSRLPVGDPRSDCRTCGPASPSRAT